MADVGDGFQRDDIVGINRHRRRSARRSSALEEDVVAFREASRNLNEFMSLGGTGAGEGVRTLDPNLGKVVLYH
jgi:hypothetical protein